MKIQKSRMVDLRWQPFCQSLAGHMTSSFHVAFLKGDIFGHIWTFYLSSKSHCLSFGVCEVLGVERGVASRYQSNTMSESVNREFQDVADRCRNFVADKREPPSPPFPHALWKKVEHRSKAQNSRKRHLAEESSSHNRLT